MDNHAQQFFLRLQRTEHISVWPKTLTRLQSCAVQSERYHNIEAQLPRIFFSDPKSLHSRP
jgi:hypothetical protein